MGARSQDRGGGGLIRCSTRAVCAPTHMLALAWRRSASASCRLLPLTSIGRSLTAGTPANLKPCVTAPNGIFKVLLLIQCNHPSCSPFPMHQTLAACRPHTLLCPTSFLFVIPHLTLLLATMLEQRMYSVYVHTRDGSGRLPGDQTALIPAGEDAGKYKVRPQDAKAESGMCACTISAFSIVFLAPFLGCMFIRSFVSDGASHSRQPIGKTHVHVLYGAIGKAYHSLIHRTLTFSLPHHRG